MFEKLCPSDTLFFLKHSCILFLGYEILLFIGDGNVLDNTMLYSTNYSDKGYFPIVDYYNVFDLIICGAGYNQFWEAIYFDKEAIFETLPRRFEDQQKRIDECQEYYFEENGADQLVELIMNL